MLSAVGYNLPTLKTLNDGTYSHLLNCLLYTSCYNKCEVNVYEEYKLRTQRT